MTEQDADHRSAVETDPRRRGDNGSSKQWRGRGCCVVMQLPPPAAGTIIMDVGVHLPLVDFGGGAVTFPQLRTYVATARDLGHATVSANDHLAWQRPWLDGPTALTGVLGEVGSMTAAASVCLAGVRDPVDQLHRFHDLVRPRHHSVVGEFRRPPPSSATPTTWCRRGRHRHVAVVVSGWSRPVVDRHDRAGDVSRMVVQCGRRTSMDGVGTGASLRSRITAPRARVLA